MTPSDIIQQQNDLMARMSRLPYGSQMYFAAEKQLGQLMAQGQAQGMTAASAPAANAVDPVEQNWKHVIDDTEGRGAAVMSDPYTSAALGRLQSVANGTEVPYTQQVQNQLLARQADAGASAMGAQRQMIENQQAALGGSMADPSAQAALRRLLGENQAHNNATLGDIQTKAQLTNFGARNDAAMNMAGVRGQQLGQANGQYNQAANYYANRQYSGGHESAVGGGYGGSYGGGGTIGGGGSFTPFTGGYQTGTGGNGLAGRLPMVTSPKPFTPMPQPTPYNMAKQNPYGAYDPSKPVY